MAQKAINTLLPNSLQLRTWAIDVHMNRCSTIL